MAKPTLYTDHDTRALLHALATREGRTLEGMTRAVVNFYACAAYSDELKGHTSTMKAMVLALMPKPAGEVAL